VCFASLHSEAAREIFLRDCLVPLGVSVAPAFSPAIKTGSDLVKVSVDGTTLGNVRAGEIFTMEFPRNGKDSITIVAEPLVREIDLGMGKGQAVEKTIARGECGVIFDGRNRPVKFPESENERIIYQQRINQMLGVNE
jgi:hypothetical protein